MFNEVKKLKKICKSLAETGMCVTMGPMEGERPEFCFVFDVWQEFNEKNLHFYYDWQIGKYYFFVWSARKNVSVAKGKPYDYFNVKDYIDSEAGHLLPYARKVARTLNSKHIYLTTDQDLINNIINDFYLFKFLVVSYITDYDDQLAGISADSDKPYFIMGDSIKAIRRLKRMGYKTVVTFDEVNNKIELLCDAKFDYNEFDWEEQKEYIEDYITDDIQNELNDCIYEMEYNDEMRMWNVVLDLSEDYEDEVKTYVKNWNRSHPFNIKCSVENELAKYVLKFQNGFIYN